MQKDTNATFIVVWKEMPKALIIPYEKTKSVTGNTKNLQKSDMVKTLESLGYDKCESKWITAMVNAYDNGHTEHTLMDSNNVKECGHSGGVICVQQNYC